MESPLTTRDAAAVRAASDAVLLTLMAQRHTDAATAQLALEEFYHRHRHYLYNVACKVGIVNASDRYDLVHETFLRVFAKAKTFKGEGTTDSVQSRRQVRAWIGRIAHRLFQDMLRKYGGLRLLGDMAAALQDDAQAPLQSVGSDEPPSPAMQALLRALDSLSAREQEIMRVTWQYYTPGQRQQRLPHDVVAQLARDCNTTPENIRKIRERALRKIKAMLLSSPDSLMEEAQP
jgi:RNA polymerase sigma factor (sigma-70 family)